MAVVSPKGPKMKSGDTYSRRMGKNNKLAKTEDDFNWDTIVESDLDTKYIKDSNKSTLGLIIFGGIFIVIVIVLILFGEDISQMMV